MKIVFAVLLVFSGALSGSAQESPGTAGPGIVSVTASSFLTEKYDINVYHPVKAFDGRKETAWVENAEGAGMGEWIEVEFDTEITVDRLLVYPGYYNPRYWKLNNRIRAMTILLDDYSFTASFKDRMITQIVNLKEPQTFRKARFIIKDVYRNEKWDDTALAGIEFLFAGKTIKADLGAFKKYLEKVPEE